MNLSMKWLCSLKLHTPRTLSEQTANSVPEMLCGIKDGLTIKQYAADLTMSGSKVEGYETEGEELKNIVVGKVLEVTKHPNADTLFICKIDAGGDASLQIVTGANNVTVGAFVPVARDNSVVAGGKKITKGKLRGEVSEGMLCSLAELGLAKNDFPYAVEDGIFLLGDDCERVAGLDIREAIGLNDTVVEFEITSNRPDCLSVLGLARETAATYGMEFAMPEPHVKAGGGRVEDLLSVTVENQDLCLRYAAAAVKNVKITTSPRWMREKLRASGVRPINNIVDITNYVMLEYGQPMHAFDLRHVGGSKIVVRNAKDGEQITTLDGNERKLSAEMLVIADEKNPSAVAGVMGGEYSGVYDDTTTVIFESACFDGASVRMTSKKLGLRTESSGRFEKGLDPENCMPALLRACELVEQLGVGDVCDGFIDVQGAKQKPAVLELKPDWMNKFLGVDIPEADMVRYLKLLGFTVEGRKVTAPSFRADIQRDADIAEEIARLYGYDKIPATALRGMARGSLSAEQKFERTISQTLIAAGYSEVVTYSFISPKYYDKIRLPKDSPLRNSVAISNPLGEDTGVMRTTAIPSMLEVLSRNYKNRNAAVRFYEIATEYLPVKGEKLPDERKQAILGAYGAGFDFFDIKAAVELLLERVGVTNWSIAAVSDNAAFHPGRYGVISVNGEEIGSIGEVHPEVADAYEIETKAYAARLDIAAMQKHARTEKSYKPMPRFPSSTRDLALVCDENLPVAELQAKIEKAAGSILEQLELFDVYRGKQVGDGKKSVAFSLTLRAADRTLTDEECDNAVQKALRLLEEIGASIRK